MRIVIYHTRQWTSILLITPDHLLRVFPLRHFSHPLFTPSSSSFFYSFLYSRGVAYSLSRHVNLSDTKRSDIAYCIKTSRTLDFRCDFARWHDAIGKVVLIMYSSVKVRKSIYRCTIWRGIETEFITVWMGNRIILT